MARNSKDDSLSRKRKVEALRDRYFQDARSMRALENGKPPIPNSRPYARCLTFTMLIETAYGKLDPVSQLIINKDFFYNGYPGWWVTTYSKSTYYRLRDKAIRDFLKLTEDADEGSGRYENARFAAI